MGKPLATLVHLTEPTRLLPARVTFPVRLGPTFQSTFRPQEALTVQALAVVARRSGPAGQRAGWLLIWREISGYNKRVRALAGQMCLVIDHLARISPSFCDRLRLLDSTPIPCGQSRETRKRSELAGWAAYGYCASHARWFWGLRLYLLCAADGMPVSFCLAPANESEREVAAAMLDRARRQGLLCGGETIIADKGFTGRQFEQIVASLDATLIRPDRKREQPRFGKLGRVRQWIESIINTGKSQLSLELHRGHTPQGAWARICQRVLALAAGVWHSRQLWEARLIDSPGRYFTNYDH